MAATDHELARSHLITARAALLRKLDEGSDPDGLHVRGLSALIDTLEKRSRVLCHNGIEYPHHEGRA